MRLVALCALISLVRCQQDLSPADSLRDKFYLLEAGLWKEVTQPHFEDKGLGGDVELSKEFVKFDAEIEALPKLPRPPLDTWLWLKASERLGFIENIYKNFIEFLRKQTLPGAVPAPIKEWLDLTEPVIRDPKGSVKHAAQKLGDLLEHGDMFRSVLLEDHPDLCELQLSPHQLIYDMYNTITLTEIKGYAMMQFSWMLLRVYNKGNFTQEASLTRERYGSRTAQTAASARAALAMAKRDLYRCDPAQHKEGETFEQVTRLLQGYIENEVDMNPDNTCKENCAYYSLAENKGCFKDQFCSKQPACQGRILDCQYIDSDMWVCPAPRGSNRRYEWIEYENGRTLGKTGTCSRGTTKVDSWWRLVLHCSYCMCLCEDDPSVSERFFSMREAVADINANKIVTGVRLVKLGRVFHLQISEGTLGARGSVVAGDWVAVQRFDPNEAGVVPDMDYHMLSYERRAIDLDELDSPLGHILTGVRFRMLGSHLHFEIRSTPFNYTTGRLSPEKSQWISNDNTDGADTPRSKLELVRPDIPTRTSGLRVDSRHDQFVEFTHSDLEADVAQSTVPFLDSQPVQPMKGTALVSGAGVIHRGARGSGGFIAIKLFTYDYSRHVKAYPPPSSIEEDETDFVPIVN